MTLVDNWPYWLLLVGLGFLLARVLYWKLPQGTVYIRDGFGGQKVILEKGVVVIPGLHRLAAASLENFSLRINATREASFFTSDPFRIDIDIRLLVCTTPTAEGVGLARKVFEANPDSISEFLEERARLVLQNIVGRLKLIEIIGQPINFEHALYPELEQELLKSGFTLELISILELKQTDQVYYQRNNSMDISALPELEVLQQQKLQRLQSSWQAAELAIKELNREAALKELEWETAFVDAKLKHRRHQAEIKAKLRQEIQEIETAQALAEKMVKQDLDMFDKQTA